MRCYFYLTNGDETIRDDHGVEVSDRETARRLAVEVVVELRAAHPQRLAYGDGWTLVAVHPTGAIYSTSRSITSFPTERWKANAECCFAR
jgi:hypothetical protein